MKARIGTAWILVDTVREILANKLCALLGRMEVRDLTMPPAAWTNRA